MFDMRIIAAEANSQPKDLPSDGAVATGRGDFGVAKVHLENEVGGSATEKSTASSKVKDRSRKRGWGGRGGKRRGGERRGEECTGRKIILLISSVLLRK